MSLSSHFFELIRNHSMFFIWAVDCLVMFWIFSYTVAQWFPKLGSGHLGGSRNAFQKTNKFLNNLNCIFYPSLYKFWFYSFLYSFFNVISWLLGCCSCVLYWCLCLHRSNTACSQLCTMLYATFRVDGGTQSWASLFWGSRGEKFGNPCSSWKYLKNRKQDEDNSNKGKFFSSWWQNV